MNEKQELKVIKVIEFRKLDESDYDAYAGAGDNAIMNEDAFEISNCGEDMETCEAIVIIDDGQVQFDLVGENYEATYIMKFADTQTAIVMLSYWKDSKRIETEKDLKALGFEWI